ncbi:hypothetical protein Ahy_B03g067410 isoform A [Arachis hypogaea]|uniref:Uncharacterized protein n=1 Tax=Arachis hypogaea TaxID=3818 RepID=A0A445A6Q7_ARAHY|nr:hypothetical protein Ahy_B03g067410 isoform A [Arachis hypogaea]
MKNFRASGDSFHSFLSFSYKDMLKNCENFIVCALDQEIAGPVNLPRRLNSGFYYAHSDGQTIAAMEKVVRHAQTSSFYDMLCVEQEDPTVSMIIDVLNPNQT